MVYSWGKKIFGLGAITLLMIVLCAVPAQAEIINISGVVVDADSREALDEVKLELLKGSQSEKKLTLGSDGSFFIEYEFDWNGIPYTVDFALQEDGTLKVIRL